MNEHHQPFEEIKLINANGAEQWSARQLGKLLGYSEYRHFIPVLTRAKEACENSGHTIMIILRRSSIWSKLAQMPKEH